MMPGMLWFQKGRFRVLRQISFSGTQAAQCHTQQIFLLSRSLLDHKVLCCQVYILQVEVPKAAVR